MVDFGHCCTAINGKLVKVEENRRKATFRNETDSPFIVVKIDNCVITDSERADYLIQCGEVHSIIVELKGSDLKKAVSQIEATLKHKNMKGLLRGKIGCVIICSKVRIPRADYFLLSTSQRFARTYRAGFKVVCDKGIFSPDDVVLGTPA